MISEIPDPKVIMRRIFACKSCGLVFKYDKHSDYRPNDGRIDPETLLCEECSRQRA